MTAGLTQLLDRVKSYHPTPDLERIHRAHQLATQLHGTQLPELAGPRQAALLPVAELLVQLKLDDASLAAALLQRALRDGLTTEAQLREQFGAEVADLAAGVVKLAQVEFTLRQDATQAESFRKMLLAMHRDIRVLLVQLADRLHEMRGLTPLASGRHLLVARETMEIYAPLANRLGIFWLKAELEDLAFRFLYPEVFEELSRKIAQNQAERETYIREVVRVIEELLRKNEVAGEVKGRPKHLWSIYQKMHKKEIPYEEVYDRVAFRVIVADLPTCYAVLGHVHSVWAPIPGRFKDYVAVPKPNSYQSLHTTVQGPTGEFIEIQIRTREMHEIAELGVSAHWRYKEGGRGVSPVDEKKFTWLRQLVESQQYLEDSDEFLDSIKVDLFSDEVFIYTPEGDVKILAAGSTPVDFAYAVHTKVGHHCTGAKVNGVMVPLRHVLKNGDVVGILTSTKQKPSKDWLEFVVTSRARSKIRAFIRREQQERSREQGRELLERELRRRGLNYARLKKSGELDQTAAACKCNTVDELLVHLVDGKIPLERVLEQLAPPPPPPPATSATGRSELISPEQDASFAKYVEKLSRPSSSGICIQGMGDILVRYARCCTPVQGDPIVGFITRGRGITVHHRDCRQARSLDPTRSIEVYWDPKATNDRAVDLKVHTIDAPGILAALTKCLTDAGVNISRAHSRVVDSTRAVTSVQVIIRDKLHLQRVIHALEKVNGVVGVERV